MAYVYTYMHMHIYIYVQLYPCTHIHTLACVHDQSLSHVRLFATPWTVACQAPLSMGFSRQEYWSGLHFLLQGIFQTQGLNAHLLCLLNWQANCLLLSHLGSHTQTCNISLYISQEFFIIKELKY